MSIESPHPDALKMLSLDPASQTCERPKEGEGLALPVPVERLKLNDIDVGDRLTITTGTDECSYTFVFETEETVYSRPSGLLTRTLPDGRVVEPVSFSLLGSGRWVDGTKDKPERTFKVFETLSVGNFMVGSFPLPPGSGQDAAEVRFDMPGQEIRAIDVTSDDL